MNILFLTAWYPVPNTPHKGIFVKEYARAIALAGHKVCVIALDVSNGHALYQSAQQRYTDESGIETHVVSIHSRFHKKIHAIFPLLSRKLKKYIRSIVLPQFSPDLIHSNVLYPAGMIGAELAHELKMPHVITEHWSKAADFLQRNFFRASGKRAYREAHAVTCVSEFLRMRITPYLEQTARVRIIPNIVRTELFSFETKTVQTPLVFAAIATWLPPKRPDLFIGALHSIALKMDNTIQLHLFGDGDQLNNIRREVYAPNLEIVYRGYCDKMEISEQLKKTHFMLHASEIETFSIVVAESLCTGTPVIASDRGALPELVEPATGVICDNTPEAWRSAILQALEKNYDHKTISTRFRTRFSAETIGTHLSGLYKEIIEYPSR